MFDTYRMDHAKGLMIVDCKDADGGAVSLKDPVCLKAVLRNLCKELTVDGLVLNHHLERHYGKRTIKALGDVLSLASVLSQLSAQEPLPDFNGQSRKETEAACLQCPLNPQNLFKRFKDLLLGDLPNIDFAAFAAEFAVRVRELGRQRDTGCRNCTRRTVDDLSFLLTQIDSFSNRLVANSVRRCGP